MRDSEYANTVNDCIIIALGDYLSKGFGIKCITSKGWNVLRFAKVEAIDIMTLLFEIEGYGMTCHTITSTYKKLHNLFP